MTHSFAAGTDSYTYPTASNRLSGITLATGGTRGFTYDASGNVTAEARAGGAYGYTYDAAGRMREFRAGGVLQAQYRYDAMGRQAVRTLVPSGLTIHSVFDSEGRRIAEYNQATGALIREYVWMGWEPVAVIEGGVVYMIFTDHIGRPVMGTTLSGTKVWSATYLPFGGVHVTTGAPIDARFPGQWFQAETGLHQNWMRDYDPTTGRYLQADPLGLVDGAGVYGYALQNPGRYVDPRGEFINILVGAVIGGVAAAKNCGDWRAVLIGAALGGVTGGFGAFVAPGYAALIGGAAAAAGQTGAYLVDNCNCSFTWGSFIASTALGAVGGGFSGSVGKAAVSYRYGKPAFAAQRYVNRTQAVGETAFSGIVEGIGTLVPSPNPEDCECQR